MSDAPFAKRNLQRQFKFVASSTVLWQIPQCWELVITAADEMVVAFSHVGFVGDVQALDLVAGKDDSLSHLLAGECSPCRVSGAFQALISLVICGMQNAVIATCQISQFRCYYVGVGSQLLVYELPSGQLVHSQTVLPDAARVHGICAVTINDGPLAVAVHGDHHVKVSSVEADGSRIPLT